MIGFLNHTSKRCYFLLVVICTKGAVIIFPYLQQLCPFTIEVCFPRALSVAWDLYFMSYLKRRRTFLPSLDSHLGVFSLWTTRESPSSLFFRIIKECFYVLRISRSGQLWCSVIISVSSLTDFTIDAGWVYAVKNRVKTESS